MNELISVIVPCFNVEKYLSNCLDTIINQTYKNLEILVINDGSKDNTQKIIDEYVLKDNRIKAFYQENQGLSAARNKGLDNASGEYYVFVDSDDDILPTMIEELYELLIKNDADIAVCDFYQVKSQDLEVPISQDEDEETLCVSGDSRFEIIFSNYLVTVVQWNKLFKKKIFDDIRFPVGMFHEDEFVIHREIFNAEKVVYTNRRLYRYHIRQQSITKSKDSIRMYHASLGFCDRIDFFNEKKLYKCAAYVLRSFEQYLKCCRIADTGYKNFDYYLPICLNMLLEKIEKYEENKRDNKVD